MKKDKINQFFKISLIYFKRVLKRNYGTSIRFVNSPSEKQFLFFRLYNNLKKNFIRIGLIKKTL